MQLAKELGATHTINTSEVKDDLEKAVRDITDQSGSTVTVDATGVVPLIQAGIEFTANQGKMILLGVAPMDAALQVAIVPFMVVRTCVPLCKKRNFANEPEDGQAATWQYGRRCTAGRRKPFTSLRLPYC